MSLRLLLLPLWIALGASSSGRGVWIVDSSGGSPLGITDIQTAVDAADDGDVILVESGSYPGFSVVGKGLVISARADADVLIAPAAGNTIALVGIQADQAVVLRGLRHRRTEAFSESLLVESCLGAVRIESCRFDSFTVLLGAPGTPTAPTLSVRNSAAVAFVGTIATGGSGSASPALGTWDASEALAALTSNVSVYGCSLLGGRGFNGVPLMPGHLDGGRGANGATIANCDFVLSGSSAKGGAGGNGTSSGGCSQGGSGGTGVTLLGSETDGYSLDSDLFGGAAGAGGSGCPSGSEGLPLVIQNATAKQLLGSARSFDVESPTQEQSSTQLAFGGEPGEFVVLALGIQPSYQFDQGLSGTLLTGVDTLLGVGLVDADSQLTVQATPNAITPQLGALSLYLQPIFIDASLTATLGPPATLIVVDDTL